MLATNVTQAQAFCIATACLQVLVLARSEPVSLVGNLLASTASKLNLLGSPELLFGAGNNKWIAGGDQSRYGGIYSGSSSTLSPEHRLGLMASRQLDYLLRSGGLLSQKGIKQLRLAVEEPAAAAGNATGKAMSGESTTTTKAPESSTKPPETTTASALTTTSTTTTTTMSSSAKPKEATTSAPPAQTTTPAQKINQPVVPTFNRMYTQIYNDAFGRLSPLRPLLWNPDSVLMASSTRTRQPFEQVASRVANLMHSMSNVLAIKRASMTPVLERLLAKTKSERTPTAMPPWMVGAANLPIL